MDKLEILEQEERLKRYELMDKRKAHIAKANTFIESARYELARMEILLFDYLVSRVDKLDESFKEETFTVTDFCKLCGLNPASAGSRRSIKRGVLALAQKKWWYRKDEKGEGIMGFIDSSSVYLSNDGVITMKLDDSLRHSLLGLGKTRPFTLIPFEYKCVLKHKDSLILFEQLEYRKYFGTMSKSIEELKELLGKPQMKTNDFMKVIKASLKEINEVTDINVSYIAQKQGRFISGIRFYINQKENVDEILASIDKRNEIMNKYI